MHITMAGNLWLLLPSDLPEHPAIYLFIYYVCIYLFIHNLFNHAEGNSGHTEPNEWMTVNNESQTTRKAAVVSRFHTVI